MKITGYQTRLLHTPADDPLANSLPDTGRQRAFVTLEMTTDEGIDGVGLTFVPALSASPVAGALRMSVDALAELTVGEDPMEIEGIVGRLQDATSGAGPGGLLTMALAAVDMALWDIKGKALGQTVASLLGGYRKSVPTYASGALMRPVNVERLAEIGPMLVEKGFRQMKTQMGAEPLASREIDRIRTLRDAVGDDIDLMCDINQLWERQPRHRRGTPGSRSTTCSGWRTWWPTTTTRAWPRWRTLCTPLSAPANTSMASIPSGS